jgi:hypothetical protein
MKRVALLAFFALGGCTWIGNTADSMGEHMPVIGERCEHWQCMTAQGKARSDAIKAQMPPKPAAPPPAPPQPAPTYPAQPK